MGNSTTLFDNVRPGQDGTSRRSLLALGLGNTLEWYDWVVFGLLVTYIGPQFFEPQNPLSATLDALAVFAIGFVARPLGGILLGTAADRLGRKPVMIFSISLMAATTLVIALSPTYDSIGVWAGALLLLCRLLQGLSAGIEAPLSTAYAVELQPRGHEGRAAGWMSFFVNLGILMASLVTFITASLLDAAAMAEWGWRIPMAVGAAMSLGVIYLRRSLPDAGSMRAGDASQVRPWRGVRTHWLGVVGVLLVVGGAQSFGYAWTVGLPTIARGYGEDPSGVFGATTWLAVILLLGSLITGQLVDRHSLSQTFLWTRLAVLPTAFLLLLYSEPGLGTLYVVLTVGGFVLVANLASYNLAAAAMLPEYCRGTGMGLGYGIGVALFGGTAPYLMVWMQSHRVLWMYPCLVAALTMMSLVVYALVRRSGGLSVGG